MDHTKNKKNHNLNDKTQSTDANTKMNQKELSDKNFKEAIIKMFQLAIMNSLETNEKYRKYQQHNRNYKE